MNTKRTVAFQVFACLAVFILLFSSVQPVLGAPPRQEVPPQPTEEAPAEPAPVETAFTVSGKVVDETGSPIAGVSVSDDQGHFALTGEDGAYALPALQPGRYVVTPLLEGVTLLPYYRVVEITDADISGADFYKGEPPAPPVSQAPGAATGSHAPKDYNGTPTSEPEMEALSAFSLGDPGFVYKYEATYGTTEEPYIVDNTHFFGVNGIDVDAADNLLMVEERGKRFVMLNSAGVHQLTIGKAGAGYNSEVNFDWPYDTTRDPEGNIWIADSNRIVKYDETGEFLLQYPPENSWEAGSDDWHFNAAYSIAFGDGMLFVADRNNHRVQVFALYGGTPVYLRTIGQTNNPGRNDDQFDNPLRVTYYDHALYVVDFNNHRIQKCEFNGWGFNCYTFLGVTGESGGDFDHLSWPTGIAFSDVNAKLYISDGNNSRVLVCDLDGSNCNHFAGVAGERGRDDSHFNWPADVDVDSSGNVYVADPESRVQIFDSAGDLIVTRGTSGQPYLTDGIHFNTPSGIAVDPDDGSIYVTEDLGARLVKLNSSGVQQWAAGESGWVGSDDQHLGSFWSGPHGNLGIDSYGRIYVPDTGNQRVQIYLPDGTLWGSLGVSNEGGDDNAHFNCPNGVAIGPQDKIYVADGCNHRIQIFDSNRSYIASLGETGVAGNDSSHFTNPWGVAVADDGIVYVADSDNFRVMKCTLSGSSGTCVPFAGVTGVAGRDFPYLTRVNAVAVDDHGRVFIADDWEQRIQVFSSDGAYLTTIGGNFGANTGHFRNPYSLAVDSSGSVYVADYRNHRIQKFTPGVPGWDQMNLNGFGSVWNRGASTLEVFNNQLYASSSSWEQGGRIWSTADGTNWSPVSDFSMGSTSFLPGVVDSIVYNGKLYYGFGWWGGSSAASIWRYDGSNWEEITGDGFGNFNNQTAYSFVAYSGNLYVAFGNYEDGVEIWRSSTGDAGSWTQVALGGLEADSNAVQITGMVVFNAKLYASVWNQDQGVEVWQFDGATWTQVNVDNFGQPNDGDGGGLAVYGGYLYVPLRNDDSGGQVWRMNVDLTWAQVVDDGFGDVNNYKVDGFYVSPDGYLYAIADNETTGMELWRTTDGAAGTWTQFGIDGFGDSNTNASLFSNAITTFKNRMFVGTWNWGNGGEVWAAKPNTYTMFGQVSGLQAGDVVTFHLLQNGNPYRTLELTAAGSTLAYSFDGLGNGTYRVIPSSGLYTFAPYSYTYFLNNAGSPPLNFTASAPGALGLVQPMNGAQPSELPILMEWKPVAGTGVKYQLQVSTSNTFATTFKNQTGITGTSFLLTGTVKNTLYYWRVRSYTGLTPPATAPWSIVWWFTTPNPPGLPVLALPAAGAVVTTTEPFFRWTAPTGTPAASYYRLQISQKINFSTLDVDEYVYGGENWFYLNQSLINNKAYYWRVRSYSAAGHASAWTAPRKFITWPEQPWLDWPCNICTAETLRPTFYWNDNTNTGAYQIVISKFGAVVLTKDVVGKSFTPTVSLVPGERYWWRVRGKGLGGYGPWSEIRNFWAPYPPGVPVLTAPANNAVISGVDELKWRPTFSWNPVPGAVHYRLQVSPQITFPEWDMRVWVDLDDTIFDWWGAGSFDPNNPDWLDPNRAYFWRVQACNENWECSIWAPTRKFFTRPGGLEANWPRDDAYVSIKGFDLNWGGLPWPEQWVNSEKFTLQFSTSPTFAVIAKTVTVANQWWVNTSLLAAGTYYWRVRAEGIGGLTGFGAWSEPQRFIAENPPAAPTLIIPAAGVTVPDFNDVYLDWSSPAGAVSYNIQIAYDTAFNNLVHEDWYLADSEYYFPPGPGVFYWRVSANNNHEVTGLWSASRKFVTLSQLEVFVGNYLNGAVLEGVEVTATKVGAPAVVFNCTTDLGGSCWMDNMPAATYNVVVTPPAGFISFANTASVAIGASKYAWQGFELVPLPSGDRLAIVTTWPYSANRELENHLWMGTGASQTHIFTGNHGYFGGNPFIEYAPHDWASTRVMILNMGLWMDNGTYPFAVQQVSPGSVVPLKGFGVKVAVFDSSGAMVAGPYGPPILGTGQWWHVFNVAINSGAATFVTAPAPIGTLLLNPPVASNPGVLSGYTVTASGAPIPHQLITVLGTSSAETVTNSDGYWQVAGLPAGNYTVTPELTDYPTWSPSAPWTVTGYDPAAGYDLGGLIGTPGFGISGFATSLKVQGHYAYALMGESLEVINISNRASPAFVSRTQLMPYNGQMLTELALDGNYAYVVGDNGLFVVSIVDPAHPVVVGHYFHMSNAMDIEVAGDYAYVTTYDRLMILNISSPSNPILVGQAYYMGGANAHITLRGNFVHMAYFNGWDSWYRVWDVSNPAAPVTINWYWLEGYATDIVMNWEQFFITGYADDGMGSTTSYVYSAPFHCGPDIPCGPPVYHLTGAGAGTGMANRVAIRYNDRYPFIADTGDGLITMDANDVWNLSESGFYATSGSMDVELDDNGYAYLLKFNSLQILHADPYGPGLAGTYTPTP